jgi:hypothetical protein
MVPSTQSHICPSIICSGRSSASKGLFGGAPAALAPSTVTEYCRGAAGPSKRWLLRLLHFAVVFCQSRSRPAARYSAAQCTCAGSRSRRERVPNSLEVLEYLPPIFFSLEMACCYCGRSILANIFVFCFFFKYLRILLQCKESQFWDIDRIDEQGSFSWDLVSVKKREKFDIFCAFSSRCRRNVSQYLVQGSSGL